MKNIHTTFTYSEIVVAPLVLSLGTSILSSQVTARKFGGTQGVIPSLTKLSFNRECKMVSPASASGKGVGHFLEFGGTPFHTISESLRQNCLTAISLFIDCMVLYCGCWSRKHLERFPTYIRCFDGRLCRCCCRRTFGYFFVSTALPRGPRDGGLVRVGLDLPM